MTLTDSESNSSVENSDMKKHYKIGIPRGLFYYKYLPLWKAFLEYLDCEVVVSRATNAKIVEEGSKAALSELCVPMKIYYGHVMDLLRESPDIDYIFIPRYISTHKTKYFCPKFMILPEAVKFGLKFNKPILILEVDAFHCKGVEGAIAFGKELGIDEEKSAKAWHFAHEKYGKFKDKAKKGDWGSLIEALDTDPRHKSAKTKIKQNIAENIRGKYPVNILVIGHAYNVYETHINQDLISRLKAMDANVLTMEQLPDEVFEKEVTINKQYHNYWENEEEIMQTVRYYLSNENLEIDGMIFLISFACGPDSLIQELVLRDMKKREIPLLELILDEHTGRAGLVTRIESFVDMIRREKYDDN